MKQLFFFCALLFAVSVSAQTNSWTGAVSPNWNIAGNWTLGIPTDTHDVVIPTGSTVNANTPTAINSITVQGSALVNLSSSIDFIAASVFEPGTTINWSAGSLVGGGTLNNAGTINMLTANNKTVNGGTVLNNSGTINIVGTGDLYITDGIVNNLAAGVIDMQASVGNLSYSSGGSHILNNFGWIKKTTSVGDAEINCDLRNTGTLSVESGSMTLNNSSIELNGGTYNVVAGATLLWNSTLTTIGNLTGTNNGLIDWSGVVSVPTTSQWNFTGSGFIRWISGTLNGGGVLTNNSVIDLVTANNKTVSGATTFNNTAAINIAGTGDLYITDGIVNNQSTGVIDLKTDSGYLSYSAGASHVLNNFGLIRRTTSSGLAVIECDLHNEGTIEVQSGTLNLNSANITLHNGTYNVSAGAFFTWNATVTVTGTLTGNVPGEIIWYGNVAVPTAQAATFAFTGPGNINWPSGNLIGGGALTNTFTMRLSTNNNKTINGGSTLNNAALIYMQSAGDLYITDGIVNNLASGTIDLRSDNASLSYSAGGSHVLNNFGLIKRTTTTGIVVIESDLVNTGTIAVESGTLILGDPEIQLNGGTYNVSAGAVLQWDSTITFSGTLGGVVNGQILWSQTPTVTTTASLDFTGSGIILWNSGTLSGGGVATNNFMIHLNTANNKTINGGTTLNNNGTIAFIDSGDLYITDGIVNNQPTGTIDLRDTNGYLSYSSGASHVLNNFGLIKKTTQAGTTRIQCLVNNSGTIDVQTGTIFIDDDYMFTNNETGMLTGIGTFDLPAPVNFTNNGIFAPGGSPGTLTVIGAYNSSGSSKIAVELNGLVPGTEHDVLAITGNAAINGITDITLGFAPNIGDAFTVLTTTGTITTCAMSATETAVRNGLEYTFGVTCADNNKLVLAVSGIKALPPTAPAQVFCAGAIVSNLEADGQNILWYDATSGGSPIDLDVQLVTATYYVTQTIDGFESDRVAVSVTVFTTPEPIAASPQVYTQITTIAGLQATGTNIQWFDDVSGAPLLPETVVVSGTYYVSQTLNGCESGRSEIAVVVNLENFFFYVDGDGDGFGTGELVAVEDGPTPPAGYSTNNTDCDDTDMAVWQSQNLFVDSDGDGYDNGSETACYGASVPVGYAATTNGADCDDADGNAFQSASLFIDNDGDGYDNGSETVCYGASVPVGYAATSNGSDCDDADGNAFQSASLFIDNDGDGYDDGSETVCYGASVPVGYAATTNGSDCDDTNAAVNPGATEIAGNNIDDNCNGATDEGGSIITTVAPATCGTTVSNINNLIAIVPLQGATSYRVRATNLTTMAQQTIVRNLPHFKINLFANYDYATTYAIDIEVQLNGTFVGYYGPSCNVSTPAILAPGGAGQITPAQCGITLPTVSTLIATTSLPGVTGYRFRVTNLTDNTAPNQVQVIDRVIHWFSLPMLSTFTYGTTYRIEVAMKTTGDYSAYGNPCTITTPTVPTLNSCGATVATVNTFLTTTSLLMVSQFRFELTNTSNAQLHTVQTPLNYFKFNSVTGYVPGQTYEVRVAVMTSGAWSPLGGVCTITAPGVLAGKGVELSGASTKVWPNPFTEDFVVKTDYTAAAKHVKVYDMTGRLIEQQQIQGNIETFSLGKQYPSGVYNLIVSDERGIQTVRVVKR